MKALLGPDEKYEIYWEPYEKILNYIGYEVKVANSVDKMLDAVKEPHDLILMEINQGSSREVTYEPALKVYLQIEENVMAGRTKFFAISDRRDLVKLAKNAGIPAANKNEFYDFEKLMKEALNPPNNNTRSCAKSVPNADAL